jgi:hypothetical protein
MMACPEEEAAMSERSNVDPVKSGKAYVVTAVNDLPAAQLADFVAAPVVVLTVESGGQVVTIHGSASLDGESVVVHEKEGLGFGKDVRTWRIREANGGFEATERSTF